MNNIEKKPGFSQVAVWPACIVKQGQGEELETYILRNFNTRVQYLETVYTGATATEPGGRADTLLALHEEDSQAFAVGGRMALGMRWLEDVIGNADTAGEFNLYPDRIRDYQTWSWFADKQDAMDQVTQEQED